MSIKKINKKVDMTFGDIEGKYEDKFVLVMLNSTDDRIIEIIASGETYNELIPYRSKVEEIYCKLNPNVRDMPYIILEGDLGTDEDLGGAFY